MNKAYILVAACVITSFLYSCSKKTTPASDQVLQRRNVELARRNDSAMARKTIDSIALSKPLVKTKVKTKSSIPKVIAVNDVSAKKTIDGRLYYDLQGHRYWRSNKDGKYYLYNISMQTDEAFKAPVKGN
jgi:hypothetical protein